MSGIDFEQLEARLVEVKTVVSGAHGRRRHTLSGHLVADGLILTCAHDVVGAESVSARLATGDRELAAEVVWPLPSDGPIDSETVDVALLRAEGLEAPIGPRPVWAEYSGFIGAVEAHGLGFPAASKDGTGRFHPTPVDGTFLPGEGRARNAMVFSVTSALPVDAATWAGLSGSMISDGRGRLLGVAAKLLPAWRDKFLLVPAPLILEQTRLRRLLGDPEPHPVASEHPLIEPAFEPLGEETDFKLVTARYGQVPFIEESHGEVLDELADWCERPRREDGPERTGAPDVAVRILLGPGGSGKTRLAAELCRRLQEDRERRWTAGFAREDESAHWESFRAPRPTLVVFDYVERPAVAAKVAALLNRLDEPDSAPGGPVRVLLVSRSATNWYDQVDDYGRGVLSRRLRIEGDAAKTALAERPFDRELKRLHFKAAFERFAAAPAEAGEDAAADRVMEAHLGVVERDGYDSPLLVHIAALLAARSGGVPSASPDRLRDALLDHLIRRERRGRWASVSGLTTSRVPLEENDQALHAIAITTLTEPTPAEAAELLNCSPLWEDLYNVNRRDAVKAALRLYPGGSRSGDGRPTRIAPVEPDLVAERLLVTVDDLGELVENLLSRPLKPRHYARMPHILALTNDHYPTAAGHFEKVLGRLLATAGVNVDDDDSTAEVLGQTLPRLIEGAIRQVRDGRPPATARMLTRALRAMSGDRRVQRLAADTAFARCEGHPELVRLRRTLYELAIAHLRLQDPGGASLRAALEGLLDTLLESEEAAAAFEAFTEIERFRPLPADSAERATPSERARFDRLIALLLSGGRVGEALWVLVAARRSWGSDGERSVLRWGVEVFTTADPGFWSSGGFTGAVASLASLEGGVPPSMTETLEGIGDELRRSQRFLEALQVGVQALKLRVAVGEPDETALARWFELDEIADQVWKSEEEALSDEFMREFMELRRRFATGHGEGAAVALERTGNRYAGRGMTSEAAQCFQDAIRTRRLLLDESGTMSRFRLIAAADDLLALEELHDDRTDAVRDLLVSQWAAVSQREPAYEIEHAIALEDQSLSRWRLEPGPAPVALMRAAERIRRAHALDGKEDYRATRFLYPREADGFSRIGTERSPTLNREQAAALREMVGAYPGGDFLLAVVLERERDDLRRAGRPEQAERPAGEAVRLYRKMDKEMRHAYAIDHVNALTALGALHRRAEKWIELGAVAKQASKIARANLERGPGFARGLAHSLTAEARADYERSLTALGAPLVEEAANLLRPMAEHDPTRRGALAEALTVFALCASKSAAWRKRAVPAAREAVEIYGAMAEEDPSRRAAYDRAVERSAEIEAAVAKKRG